MAPERMGPGDDEWTPVGIELAESFIQLATDRPDLTCTEAIEHLDASRGYDVDAVYQAYRALRI